MTLTATSLVIVTMAVLLLTDESATLVATIETVEGCGKFCGAVKRPLPEIVPVAAFPPATLFTDHVTAVFVVLLTTAVN